MSTVFEILYDVKKDFCHEDVFVVWQKIRKILYGTGRAHIIILEALNLYLGKMAFFRFKWLFHCSNRLFSFSQGKNTKYRAKRQAYSVKQVFILVKKDIKHFLKKDTFIIIKNCFCHNWYSKENTVSYVLKEKMEVGT